jgi:hypothetical protein
MRFNAITAVISDQRDGSERLMEVVPEQDIMEPAKYLTGI